MRTIIIILSALLLTFTSCTKQQMARKFGGNSELILPENQKLVTITWKETELWYLTKPMKVTDTAETYIFMENSNFGILEGSVTIIEVKK